MFLEAHAALQAIKKRYTLNRESDMCSRWGVNHLRVILGFWSASRGLFFLTFLTKMEAKLVVMGHSVWNQGCLTRDFAALKGRYSLEVRREHDGGPEQRAFFDLPAETENSILLEALADVQDVLILQCDETDLLQTSTARLLDQPNHRLWDGERGRKWVPQRTTAHLHALRLPHDSSGALVRMYPS